MSARDWMVVAAWTGGIVTGLFCLFCLTRSPIEIASDLVEWLKENKPRMTRAKYEGRRRLAGESDGGPGDTPMAAGTADGGPDTEKEEVAA